MEFLGVGIILFTMFQVTGMIDGKKFIGDLEPYFRFLMENDYEFLLQLKYGSDVDVNKMYSVRVRNSMFIIVGLIFVFLTNMSFVNIIISVIVGFVVFKSSYSQLKKFYKQNLHTINLMLPYYLKSLEILIQHYTVPVALNRSIDSAPDIFKPGLYRLTARIEAGDSTVEPYMEFAREYPVRDSMRMMRLLYRLGLGAQEHKQEQLVVFAKTVSSLQNKSREQKYKERLDSMEKQTLMMLGATGGGILFLMLFAMMNMVQT